MSSKFCPKCGKKEIKSNPLVTHICQSCFAKENPLLDSYKEAKIVICPSCNSFMDKNKWETPYSHDKKTNQRKILKKIIPEKLKFTPFSKIENVEVNPDFTKDTQFKKTGIIESEVELTGTIHKTKSKESYIIPARIESSICNVCKKKNSSYYEAIIQVRPKDEKLLNFIKKDIGTSKKSHITKFEESKHGYDLYVTDKSYIKNILPKVSSKFNIESKFSRTLFGKKEGKLVYRVTLLLRLKE